MGIGIGKDMYGLLHIVPQYEGRQSIEEERALLFLRALVGVDTATGSSTSGPLSSIDEEEVLETYSLVQGVLRGRTWYMPAWPSEVDAAADPLILREIGVEIPTIMVNYLEIERCFCFLVGALNCYVRWATSYRLNHVLESDHLESLLEDARWDESSIVYAWGGARVVPGAPQVLKERLQPRKPS